VEAVEDQDLSGIGRWSQSPPRCRVSGTVGIPVISGMEDVKV